MDWFSEGSSGNVVDVLQLLDSKAHEYLMAMVQAGALVSIGLTSDGGALALTITVDGKWRREYFRDGEQLELWTEQACLPVVEAASTARASRAASSRKRGLRGL